jgi:hypothetical protein
MYDPKKWYPLWLMAQKPLATLFAHNVMQFFANLLWCPHHYASLLIPRGTIGMMSISCFLPPKMEQCLMKKHCQSRCWFTTMDQKWTNI